MTAAPANGVNFVNKDEARRVFARLFEHVADAASTDTDEHFHEIGAADAKERGIGFAGDCLGEQSLAGAGRADHQYAFGDTAAQPLKLFRVFEELNQFRDFLDCLVNARHVFESCFVSLFSKQSSLALAETQG